MVERPTEQAFLIEVWQPKGFNVALAVLSAPLVYLCSDCISLVPGKKYGVPVLEPPEFGKLLGR